MKITVEIDGLDANGAEQVEQGRDQLAELATVDAGQPPISLLETLGLGVGGLDQVD